MLYVFQVDTGTMLTFDMNLALDSVSSLQTAISIATHIPPNSQVLLVSGGDCLETKSRVCSYTTAGTDTNPIFLFNKANIESSPNTSNNNNQQEIETITPLDLAGCLNLPPTYSTLITRSNLAQNLYESGKDIRYKCEGLIHDQHLQHQGWGAVIANLEDIVGVFQRKIQAFQEVYQEYQETELDLEQVLNRLPTVIESLGKLPLLPQLVDKEEDLTLLNWISNTEANSLEKLAENCRKSIEMLDQNSIENLIKEAASVLDKAGQTNMKEIKGLTTRLSKLDELLEASKKLVTEQQELSTAFAINSTRANDLKDTSILPDLCLSHEKQIQVMCDNHRKLEDICRRCSKAKEELSLNLNTRLKWVMFVQKNISEINLKLSVFFESLKKLQVMRGVLEQVSVTEQVYLEGCYELARRRNWEDQYFQTGAKLKSQLEQCLSEEIERRKSFLLNHSKHFLMSSIFSDLDDFPKTIFCEFKQERSLLPNITNEDLTNIFKKEIQIKEKFLQTELEEKSEELECRKTELENQLEENRKLNEKLEKLTQDFENERIKYELILTENEEKYERKIIEIEREMKNKFDKDLIEFREKSKQDLDAVKSRVKFLNKIEEHQEQQQTTDENCDSDNDIPAEITNLSLKLEGKIATNSCRVGDTVLIYWSEKYEAFVVFQQQSHVHFLHTECAAGLRDPPVDKFTGCVIDKEFCVARRSQNRYKVAQGFHFYRIKVRQLDKY